MDKAQKTNKKGEGTDPFAAGSVQPLPLLSAEARLPAKADAGELAPEGAGEGFLLWGISPLRKHPLPSLSHERERECIAIKPDLIAL